VNWPESFSEMSSPLRNRCENAAGRSRWLVVGELAAGLATRSRNPMAGIKGRMSVLSEESYISPRTSPVLQKVVAEITSWKDVMKSFLNFAKPQKPRLEPVNVNQIAEHNPHLSPDSPGPSAPVIPGKSGSPGVRGTLSDAGGSHPAAAVFLNLFLNAPHAMPGGGELGVRTCLEETESRSGSVPTPGPVSAKISSTRSSAVLHDENRRGPGLGLRSPSR